MVFEEKVFITKQSI